MKKLLITFGCLLVLSGFAFAVMPDLLIEAETDDGTIMILPDEFCLPTGWAMKFTILEAYDYPIVYVSKEGVETEAVLEDIFYEQGIRYTGWIYMPYPKDEVEFLIINGIEIEIN